MTQESREFGDRLVSSVAWSAAALPFAAAFPWIASIVLFRTLGPVAFGTYVLLRTVGDTALLYTDLGLSSALQRLIPELRDANEERRLLSKVAAIKAALVALFGVLVFAAPGVLSVIGLEDLSPTLSAAVFVLVAERNASLFAQGKLTADLRLRTLSLLSIPTGALIAAVTAGVAVATHDVAAVLWAFVGAECLQTAIYMAAGRPATPDGPREGRAGFSTARLRAYIVSSLGVKASRYVVGPAYAALVLGAFESRADVASFAVAFAVVSGGLGLLLTPVTRMSTAIVASAFASSRSQGRAAVDMLLRMTLIVAVPFTAGAVGIGDLVVEGIYGADAESSALLLGLLAFATAVASVTSVSTIALQNADEFTVVNALSLVTFVIGLVAVATLGSLSGLGGVAGGLALTSLVAGAGTMSLLARRGSVALPAGFLLRMGAASAPLAVIAAGHELPAPGRVSLALAAAVLCYVLFRLSGGIGEQARALITSSPHPVARLIARAV